MAIIPGDPAPFFTALETDNPKYSFGSVGGRNIVLSFIDNAEEQKEFCTKLAKLPYFDDANFCLFFVTPNSLEQERSKLPLRIPGIRAFYDTDRNIADLYGLKEIEHRPITFILSPRLQVTAMFGNPNPDECVALIDNALKTMPRPNEMSGMLKHAPVLMIPFVFEPELCQELITYYKTHESYESGFMRDVNGKTTEIHDKYHKSRRDVELAEDEPLIKKIQNRFYRRVIPEIQKSFQFNVSRMERYIVACYNDKDGGYFRPHRDNTTLGTAHRRFAISLNLNSNEYDGGDLRFPEFGNNTYRAPTGGCVVFSCSLLHEATPITRGTRYAFLPFLYDEAARELREENFKHLDEQVYDRIIQPPNTQAKE